MTELTLTVNSNRMYNYTFTECKHHIIFNGSVMLDSYSPINIIRHFIATNSKEIQEDTYYTFEVDYIPVVLKVWFKKRDTNQITFTIQII